MAAGFLVYSFSTQTVEPPTGTQLRFDSGPPYTSLSKVWMRFTTNDGADVYHVLQDIPVGARCFLQDKNDHTRFIGFVLLGPAEERAGYMEFPIAYVMSAGAPLANQDAALVVADPSITVALAPRTLYADVSASATQIALAGGPVPADRLVSVDEEVMRAQRIVVTTSAYVVCQVLRGIAGTAAVRHVAQTTCYLSERRGHEVQPLQHVM